MFRALRLATAIIFGCCLAGSTAAAFEYNATAAEPLPRTFAHPSLPSPVALALNDSLFGIPIGLIAGEPEQSGLVPDYMPRYDRERDRRLAQRRERDRILGLRLFSARGWSLVGVANGRRLNSLLHNDAGQDLPSSKAWTWGCGGEVDLLDLLTGQSSSSVLFAIGEAGAVFESGLPDDLPEYRARVMFGFRF